MGIVPLGTVSCSYFRMLIPRTPSSVAHACPSPQPAGAGAQDLPPLHGASTAGHGPGPSGCPDPRVSTQVGWGLPAPLQRGCIAQGEGALHCWALGRESGAGWLCQVLPHCCWRAWQGCWALEKGQRPTEIALSWICPCPTDTFAHIVCSGSRKASPFSPGYSGPPGSLGTAPERSSAHLPPGPSSQPCAALRRQEPTPHPRGPSHLPHPPQHPQGHPARGAASPHHAGQPAGVW